MHSGVLRIKRYSILYSSDDETATHILYSILFFYLIIINMYEMNEWIVCVCKKYFSYVRCMNTHTHTHTHVIWKNCIYVYVNLNIKVNIRCTNTLFLGTNDQKHATNDKNNTTKMCLRLRFVCSDTPQFYSFEESFHFIFTQNIIHKLYIVCTYVCMYVCGVCAVTIIIIIIINKSTYY